MTEDSPQPRSDEAIFQILLVAARHSFIMSKETGRSVEVATEYASHSLSVLANLLHIEPSAKVEDMFLRSIVAESTATYGHIPQYQRNITIPTKRSTGAKP